ncbi:MAG: HAMP domain-containing protein, partial [SAR324 cluster bacterium]|nr:HAMP domain-containing protein [SAR324 cluster bacterium]
MRVSSIRVKLAGIVILFILAGSLLNILYNAWSAWSLARNAIRQKAVSVAEFAALNSSQPVWLKDGLVLETSLQGLEKNPDLVYALFTDNAGEVLSSLPETQSPPFQAVDQTTVLFQNEQIQVSVPIDYDANRVGYLFLGLSLAETNQQLIQDVKLALGFNLSMGVIIILLLLGMLRKILLHPLSLLFSSARNIQKEQLSIQALTSQIQSKDEMGQLARSFEEMTGALAQSRATILRQNEMLIEKKNRLESMIRYLSSYLPGPVVKHILAQGEQSGGILSKRAKISFLFSDLSGFAQLTTALEASELSKLLEIYQDEMTRIVNRYEGTLVQVLGDGM